MKNNLQMKQEKNYYLMDYEELSKELDRIALNVNKPPRTKPPRKPKENPKWDIKRNAFDII